MCAPTSTPPVPSRGRSQGAESNHKNLLHEPADHALGRSRGGGTTKIHALSDAWCAPVTVLLSAGQDGDNPMLAPLLCEHPGAHRQQNLRLLGDKAYSHPNTRARLRQMKIRATIPERCDQITRRKAKGCAGGRPPAFDPELYCHRNTVERGFNRLKQWRGVASRYDKYALTYLGGVMLAAILIHHRVRQLADTP